VSGRSERMQLVRRLKSAGFLVERTGSGHWRVTNPNREGVVLMAFSPTSTANHKTLKQLAAIGYKG
jgi:predicted RNA binding protein YcfA (HicA-like mRNA interferase family)